jgi:hypothetical protein
LLFSERIFGYNPAVIAAWIRIGLLELISSSAGTDTNRVLCLAYRALPVLIINCSRIEGWTNRLSSFSKPLSAWMNDESIRKLIAKVRIENGKDCAFTQEIADAVPRSAANSGTPYNSLLEFGDA